MSRYFLTVVYKAAPEWPHPQRLDERLEKLLKLESNGSGYGMGERDIGWGFKTQKQVDAAAEKVRNYLKKETKAAYRRAKVYVYDSEEDE